MYVTHALKHTRSDQALITNGCQQLNLAYMLVARKVATTLDLITRLCCFYA